MALLTLSMLAAAGAGYALDTLWRSGSPEAAWRLMAPKGGQSPAVQAARLAKPLTLLVAVCDEAYEARAGAKVLGLRGRAEALLLVRMDPAHQAVRALGIPGATLLEGEALASLNVGQGVDALRRGVESLTGQKVDRHLVLNAQGAAQLLDALGGVSVDLAEAMDYEDRAAGWSVHLPTGRRSLRGAEAVGYMRFRGPAGGAQDHLGRVQRQQAFLSATLDAFVAPTNWPKAPQLLAIARRNLTTDLPPEEVVGIALWAKDLPREAFTLANFPGREGRDLRGRWAWVPALGEGRALAARLLAESPFPPPDPATASVSVVDLGGDPSAGADAFNALVATGWRGAKRVMPGSSQAPLPRTRIVVGNGDRALGQAMLVALGLGDVVVDGSGDPTAQITLQVGRDWALRRRDAERGSPAPSPALPSPEASPSGVLEAPVPLASPSPAAPSAAPSRRPAQRPSPPPPPEAPWAEPSPVAIVGPSPRPAAPSPRAASPSPRPVAPRPPSPVAPVPVEPSPAEGPREPEEPVAPSVGGEAPAPAEAPAAPSP